MTFPAVKVDGVISNEEPLQIDLVSFCTVGFGLIVKVLLVTSFVPHSFVTASVIE